MAPSVLPVLLSTAYAGVVLFKVFKTTPINLYIYHPIAACASLPLSVLGLYQTQSIRGPQTAAGKEKKTQSHALLIWGSVLSMITAFTAIYLNKEKFHKPHGATSHGKGGFLVSLLFTLQALMSGIGYNFSRIPFFKNIKQHRIGGYVIMTASIAVHALAVWKGYTGYKTLPEKSFLLALLGATAALSIANADRSAPKQE